MAKLNVVDVEGQVVGDITLADEIFGRIIEYRNRTAFNSIEDLKNIKGIGEATFEKLRDRITV